MDTAKDIRNLCKDIEDAKYKLQKEMAPEIVEDIIDKIKVGLADNPRYNCVKADYKLMNHHTIGLLRDLGFTVIHEHCEYFISWKEEVTNG